MVCRTVCVTVLVGDLMITRVGVSQSADELGEQGHDDRLYREVGTTGRQRRRNLYRFSRPFIVPSVLAFDRVRCGSLWVQLVVPNLEGT